MPAECHVVGGLERARLTQLAADERRPVAVDRDGGERRDERQRLREREARRQVRAGLHGAIDRALVLAGARERVEALGERVLAADQQDEHRQHHAARDEPEQPRQEADHPAPACQVNERRDRDHRGTQEELPPAARGDVLAPRREAVPAADVADRDGRRADRVEREGEPEERVREEAGHRHAERGHDADEGMDDTADEHVVAAGARDHLRQQAERIRERERHRQYEEEREVHVRAREHRDEIEQDGRQRLRRVSRDEVERNAGALAHSPYETRGVADEQSRVRHRRGLHARDIFCHAVPPFSRS